MYQIYGKQASFFEGPTFGPDGVLYFSNYRKSEIWCYDGKSRPKKTVSLKKGVGANGLFVTSGGVLWACDMNGGRLVTIDVKTGKVRGRACNFGGDEFDDPNDLIMDRNGGVYFSCPGIWPLNWPWEKKAKRGVYYLESTGKKPRIRQLLTGEVSLPNGVLLSPDESTFYVVQHALPNVLKFDVVKPGQLSKRRQFCTLYQGTQGDEGGDGLTIDDDGNVFIATRKGVEVFSPKGKSLELIKLPKKSKADYVSNVAFGGSDGNVLFATGYSRGMIPGWSGLFSIELKSTRGHVFPGNDEQHSRCA